MPKELIRIKKGGGPITVEIRITGLVDWVYDYAYRGLVESEESPDGEMSFDIAEPEQLETHEWDIAIARRGDKKETAEVTLLWTQTLANNEKKVLHIHPYGEQVLDTGTEGKAFQDGVRFLPVTEL